MVTREGWQLLSVPVPGKLPFVALREGDVEGLPEVVVIGEPSVEELGDSETAPTRPSVAYEIVWKPPGYSGMVESLVLVATASMTAVSSHSSCPSAISTADTLLDEAIYVRREAHLG